MVWQRKIIQLSSTTSLSSSYKNVDTAQTMIAEKERDHHLIKIPAEIKMNQSNN